MLDLGFCYIHPDNQWAKKFPLKLENLTTGVLTLSAQSNLMNEVLIFSDEKLTKPAEENDSISIQPKKSVVVYVCVKPNLKLNYEEGERQLVGGIRFKLKSTSTPEEIFLKFKGVLGQSHFRVSSNVIDLGETK